MLKPETWPSKPRWKVCDGLPCMSVTETNAWVWLISDTNHGGHDDVPVVVRDVVLVEDDLRRLEHLHEGVSDGAAACRRRQPT